MNDEQHLNADQPTLSPSLVRGLTRRRMLAAGASFGAIGALAACGTPGTSAAPATSGSGSTPAGSPSTVDRSDVDKKVRWSNWPGDLDFDSDTNTHPTLVAFTEKTGIEVVYNAEIMDNDEFFAKIKPALSAGRDCERDTFCLLDWMSDRMIRLGWLQPLDYANIPNAKNIEPSLKSPPSDPDRTYTLPYQNGFTGIATNTKVTKGKTVETVNQLLTDPDLHGKVTLLTEMRDTVGLVMIDMDIDPADFTDDDFDAAIAKIQSAVDSGQVAQFNGNDYGKGLATGDIAAAMAWTGDVVQLQADSPALEYALPEKGHMAWSDDFMIPIMSPYKKNAELLINYYFDPVPIAEVALATNYIMSVVGTKDILLAKDPSVANNPLIFPSDEVRNRSHKFRGLTPDEETRYNQAFQTLMGA